MEGAVSEEVVEKFWNNLKFHTLTMICFSYFLISLTRVLPSLYNRLFLFALPGPTHLQEVVTEHLPASPEEVRCPSQVCPLIECFSVFELTRAVYSCLSVFLCAPLTCEPLWARIMSYSVECQHRSLSLHIYIYMHR